MNRTRCPICDRSMEGASVREFPDFPFCCPRCRQIDLGRWLGERYRLAAADPSVISAAEPDGFDADAPP